MLCIYIRFNGKSIHVSLCFYLWLVSDQIQLVLMLVSDQLQLVLMLVSDQIQMVLMLVSDQLQLVLMLVSDQIQMVLMLVSDQLQLGSGMFMRCAGFFMAVLDINPQVSYVLSRRPQGHSVCVRERERERDRACVCVFSPEQEVDWRKESSPCFIGSYTAPCVCVCGWMISPGVVLVMNTARLFQWHWDEFCFIEKRRGTERRGGEEKKRGKESRIQEQRGEEERREEERYGE